MSVEQLYNLLIQEMRELREVNQSILKFMGESTNDRINLHKRLDHYDGKFEKYDRKFETLESGDQKKKCGH